MKATAPATEGKRRHDQAGHAVRWALGGIFIVAGIYKLADPGRFHGDLLAYEIGAPDQALRWVAVVFPWLEVICGGALMANFWPETVAAVVAGMGGVFVLMLGQAVLRGLDLQCGCFGGGAAGWFDRPLAALGRAALLLWGAGWLLLKANPARSVAALSAESTL